MTQPLVRNIVWLRSHAARENRFQRREEGLWARLCRGNVKNCEASGALKKGLRPAQRGVALHYPAGHRGIVIVQSERLDVPSKEGMRRVLHMEVPRDEPRQERPRVE
eukprot:scaffold106569_cov31-Tisochrysis_lutea.AAC.2